MILIHFFDQMLFIKMPEEIALNIIAVAFWLVSWCQYIN